MNVLALGLLSAEVRVRVDDALRDLGQLGVNVEREGAELADVDALALAQVVVQVGYQSSPHNEHLHDRIGVLPGTWPRGASGFRSCVTKGSCACPGTLRRS